MGEAADMMAPVLPAAPFHTNDPRGRLRGAETTPGVVFSAGRGAEVARDFESVFLHRLLEEMRRTIPDSGLLETGISDQVQGLFWFYLAQEIARQGGVGLWKDLARQMHLDGRDPAAAPRLELKA